ncbi:MAG: type II toxin-antitoxin system RelE/ParE family toxin [Candidatus Ruthia sp.]|jgi:mRNA-degrading endonuclease RelE of RelBE toxin-antitoxin system|nr:type II toxin-antitoxin system RelE/ParE family toxin [Candidatus Ruthturnera sp.]MBT4668730.1 type II toxin-antitoxin system RelE/ParE family toxin [Candidatus Ruthturnera sp.]
MRFVFTNKAKKQFTKLDKQAQERIKDKLTLLKQDKNLLDQNLKSVINLLPVTHRIRVGSYRLLLSEDNNGFIVLKVAHRSQVYQ